jgi:hypothetical protein
MNDLVMEAIDRTSVSRNVADLPVRQMQLLSIYFFCAVVMGVNPVFNIGVRDISCGWDRRAGYFFFFGGGERSISKTQHPKLCIFDCGVDATGSCRSSLNCYIIFIWFYYSLLCSFLGFGNRRKK